MQLLPKLGIGAVQIGMKRDDVIATSGPPRLKRKNFRHEEELVYDSMIAVLDAVDKRVIEVSALPEASLFYDKWDLFFDPRAWRELIAQEPDPREYVGIIVLPSLQVALSGFHDNDPAQKSITVFAKGRWDHLQPKLRPFKLSDDAKS